MKKLFKLAYFIAFVLILSNCSKEYEVPDNIIVHDFVWKGLNAYYLWQEEVPNLANNRFSNYTELYTHFRNFNSPESSFNSLLYQPGVSDKFSWIVDDYVALENSFQGINLSTGMEFGLKR